MAGASSVPDRTSRSWPPPCSTGTGSMPLASSSAPTPTGPPILWAVMVRAVAPLAARSTGSWPAAWTASVWNGIRYSRAIWASSAMGWMVPTSLLAHMTLISATLPGRLLDGGAQVAGLHPAGGLDGQPVGVGALVLGEPVHAVEDGVVLGLGDAAPGAGRVGCAAGPEQALDGQVVGLGAAAGEDDLAGPGAVDLGDLLPGLLDDAARAAAGVVQGGGVAELAELLGHGRQGLGHA